MAPDATTTDTREAPIRLIVGIGNNWVQGFAAVYERLDGSAGSINVWFGVDSTDEDGALRRVHFIDEGTSRIVWRKKSERSGWLGKEHTTWDVAEILIRRDWMQRANP